MTTGNCQMPKMSQAVADRLGPFDFRLGVLPIEAGALQGGQPWAPEAADQRIPADPSFVGLYPSHLPIEAESDASQALYGRETNGNGDRVVAGAEVITSVRLDQFVQAMAIFSAPMAASIRADTFTKIAPWNNLITSATPPVNAA